MANAPARDDEFYAALFEDDPEELYDNAPCGYLSMLPDGLIVKVNQTFLNWTRYERSELVRVKRFPDLLRIGDRIYYETHLAPLMRLQGQVREIAVELPTANGEMLAVLINAVTKADEDGNPQIVRVAVFDARERRAYERELVFARERAQASERKARALAATLQRSLLPPELPRIPGIEIGAAFRPAGDGSELGGDFYDVFDTGGANWGVVLGDVCGKGAQAAAITSLVRYTVRAAAVSTAGPSAALALVHQTLMRHDRDTFCTALFMTVTPGPPVMVQFAAAGHPLPFVRHADGAVERVGTPGSLLGMITHHASTETTVELAPGDAIVLYTDGVVEARRDEEFYGEDRLRRVIGDVASGGAQEIADAISSTAVEFQSGDTRDDIAVVALSIPA